MKKTVKIASGIVAVVLVAIAIAYAAGLTTPSSLVVTIVSCQHNHLTWTESKTTGVTGYDINRSTSSSGPFTHLANANGSGTLLYDDFAVLAGPGIQYWYKVAATNFSTGATSPFTAAATGGAQPACSQAPSNIFVQQVQCSCKMLKITFTDNSSSESGFVLQRDTSSAFSGPTSISLPANAGSGGTVTYFDNGLSASITYWYRVWAIVGGVNTSTNTVGSGTAPTPCNQTVNTTPCPQ